MQVIRTNGNRRMEPLNESMPNSDRKDLNLALTVTNVELKHLCWHLFASPVICGTGMGASLYWSSFSGLLFATALGISYGYFTLLSCWVVFGNSRYRVVISLAAAIFFCFFLSMAFLVDHGLWNTEFQAAILVGISSYSVAMIATNFLIARVSRISIKHVSHFDPSTTEQLRYGIGELLLVTAAAAVLLAAGKVLTTENVYDRPVFVGLFVALVVIGLVQCVIYWPTFLATLSSRHRLPAIVLSICVFSVAVIVEAYIFRHMRWGGDWNEIVVVTGMLNFPFAIAVIVHLTIVNRFGYRLTMKERELDRLGIVQPSSELDA